MTLQKEQRMKYAKVYQATVKGKPAWCLQWKTAIMPAPAFYYYQTEQEAKQAKARMK